MGNPKFSHDLAAGSAGRHRSFRISRHKQGFKIAYAFFDGCKDSISFGADRQSVRCIFDIAARKTRPSFALTAAPTAKWEYGT